MRIFRILKLVSFLEEMENLKKMIAASSHRIIVFLTTISCIVLILGSTMYWVEGPKNGFVSIPTGIYWAIVTMTTVGYGDVVASTPLGKVIASLMMIIGYSIIAVPAGLVSSEIISNNDINCSKCKESNHNKNANYCFRCGEEL
jgi:voltage-gated potassium channel